MSDNGESSDQSIKKKRKRTIILPEQIEKLEKLFLEEPWPNRNKKEVLADEIGQTEHFVSVWFQNRRARFKKEEIAKQQNFIDKMTANRHLMNNPFSAVPNHNISIHQKNQDIEMDKFAVNTIPNQLQSDQECSNEPEALNTTLLSNASKKFEGNLQSPITSSHGFETKKVMNIFVKPVSVEKSHANKPTTKSIYSVVPTLKVIKTVPKLETFNSQLKGVWSGEKDCNDIPPQANIHDEANQEEQRAFNDYNKTLLRSIINMICVKEGGIMDRNDPDYDSAVNDACYGIVINGNQRLVYDKQTGLSFVPMNN